VIRQARSLAVLRVLAVLVVLALLAGGYGIWYLFFRRSSFLVLSVDDHGVMELQLHFVHA